jgi:Icc-related predicted phosphoesterase
MNVNYVSDLHMETKAISWVVPHDADVVVIAGDLWNGADCLLWLESFRNTTDVPIVYVPGNHCFWGENLLTWPTTAKAFCDRIGVEFLYNRSVVIDDAVFLGTTLWTDFALLGNTPLKMIQALGIMKDYSRIQGASGFITPDEILTEHHQALRFLENDLAAYSGQTRCVVTHHAPSRRSIPAINSHSRYTPYYASNLEGLISEYQPEVWIHGHIHSSVQYFLGETMVVGNPRGHGSTSHRNLNFEVDLVLEF